LDALAEREVVAQAGAVRVEGIGIGEQRLVSVGRREHDHDSSALRDVHTLELVVLRADTEHALRRRREAQRFLDHVRGSARILLQAGPLIGTVRQQPHRLGQQLGRGLVTCHQQLLHDAEHLGHVERTLVRHFRIVVVDARLQ